MVLEYVNRYRDEIKRCLEDLKKWKTFYKQIPNMLTFSRAALSPISSILFLSGHPIIGVIFTGSLLITDLFDGKLARKWSVQSKFGADLDAFCDKFMFLWLALPLIINNPIIILNFVLEGVISGINVFGRMKGLNTKTVFTGKIKTCFLSLMLISGYLVQFLNLSLSVLNVLIWLTFVSQCVAIGNYVQEYIKLNNEKRNLKVMIEDDNDSEIIFDKKEDLVDSLRKEREFILGFNEPDKKNEPNIKIRNKDKE